MKLICTFYYDLIDLPQLAYMSYLFLFSLISMCLQPLMLPVFVNFVNLR